MAPTSVAFVPRVCGYQNRKVAVIYFGVAPAFLRLVCHIGVVMVLLFAVSLRHWGYCGVRLLMILLMMLAHKQSRWCLWIGFVIFWRIACSNQHVSILDTRHHRSSLGTQSRN